jgi:hypothetical protein
MRRLGARELSLAVEKCHVEAVRWLLGGGVHPNDLHPLCGEIPLLQAVKRFFIS